MQVIEKKCPHCASLDTHVLESRGGGFERPTYRCTTCDKLMVECHVCPEMTRGEGLWGNALCDNHWNEEEGFIEGEIACITEWARQWRRYPETFLNRAARALGMQRSIESFQLRKLSDGPSPVSVIYVNGLLSQGESAFSDWQMHGSHLFPGMRAYGLRWEARRAPADTPLPEAARDVARDVSTLVATYGAAAPLLWHYTMSRAEDTGKLLAAILSQTRKQRFILCGHSLGARVIFFALRELAKRNRHDLIRTAHLLGGAVGANAASEWRGAVSACEGGINNYYSRNDDVLRFLYQPASAFRSNPIGLGPIGVERIRDIDVTSFVDGHTGHKTEFGKFARWCDGL